jgi:hypothetical protein
MIQGSPMRSQLCMDIHWQANWQGPVHSWQKRCDKTKIHKPTMGVRISELWEHCLAHLQPFRIWIQNGSRSVLGRQRSPDPPSHRSSLNQQNTSPAQLHLPPGPPLKSGSTKWRCPGSIWRQSPGFRDANSGGPT